MKPYKSQESLSIAVVVPAYKVSRHVLDVVKSIPDSVKFVLVVDDACPENSGKLLENNDIRRAITIIRHEKNLGVGGAMKSGYRRAIELGADVVIKIDGDGQMDCALIPEILSPILLGRADYTKGNRFYFLNHVKGMPRIRLIGNVLLSFLSKISTGYYHIFDPTNGFTAIRTSALKLINLDSVDDRYFFESDMLYQLSSAGMRVEDVPTPAIYKDEISNLNVGRSVLYFLRRHLHNTIRRIATNYFLRDFSLASIQLLLGLLLASWGSILGLVTWLHSQSTGMPSQPGTIVLVAILCLSGLQLLLSFIQFDMSLNRRNQS